MNKSQEILGMIEADGDKADDKTHNKEYWTQQLANAEDDLKFLQTVRIPKIKKALDKLK